MPMALAVETTAFSTVIATPSETQLISRIAEEAIARALERTSSSHFAAAVMKEDQIVEERVRRASEGSGSELEINVDGQEEETKEVPEENDGGEGGGEGEGAPAGDNFVRSHGRPDTPALSATRTEIVAEVPTGTIEATAGQNEEETPPPPPAEADEQQESSAAPSSEQNVDSSEASSEVKSASDGEAALSDQ